MSSSNTHETQLNGARIAILATDGFEEAELTGPLKALQDAGAQVDVIAPHGGQIQAFQHHDKSITVPVTKTLDEARAEDYDGLVLPGGALNADEMRTQEKVKQFVAYFDSSRKPLSVICHAPWELVSAGLIEGRTLTSWPSIQDDIKNAGGNWVDREVVVDGNLVTSRMPDDLPAFNRETISLIAKSRQELAGAAR